MVGGAQEGTYFDIALGMACGLLSGGLTFFFNQGLIDLAGGLDVLLRCKLEYQKAGKDGGKVL